ncbi:MAG: VWA domain-containing protein, partial [Chloroflexota bacterium]|nr:VWA domain-containing protein [Chloroflexota bacterium]
MRTRYSRWDGTQLLSGLDADELMRALSDDVMQSGDLDLALQRLFRWGFERPDGEHVPGLREMMERLKERRQEQLNRYDLGSILDDIRQKLGEVLRTEREGIARRLAEHPSEPATPEASAPSESEKPAWGAESGQSGSGDTTGSGLDGEAGPETRELQKMLERIAERKLEQLASLPSDPGGAIRGLHDYEFLDPDARRLFQELVEMLQ